MIRTLKKKLAKVLCGVLVFAQLGTMQAFARPDWPSDTGIEAEAGAVMDVDTGTMLFGQNSHVEYYPASITKILTALVVLEHADLTDTVTYSDKAMNNVEEDSSSAGIDEGDQLTVRDCLYALLLASVNQAANALAEHVAGSIPDFVDMMNAKIAELGCTESHFANPSGLNNDDQVVTAFDMTKIAAAAYSNPKLLEISSAKSWKVGPTTNNPDGVSVRNEHRLVITEDTSSEYYCPEAVAGKTGYLLKAGNTLVTYGEKDGRRVVSVILKGSPRQYFIDGKSLLQFGLNRFQNVDIAENETRYVTGEDQVDVNGTSYAPSDLAIQTGKKITLPKDATFADAELSLGAVPDGAPEGTVGVLNYIYNERKIGSAYLMTKAGAEALAAETSAAEETSGESTDAADPSADDESTEDEMETMVEAEVTTAADDADNASDQAGSNDVKTGFPVKILLIVIGVLAVAALIGGGIWFTIRNNKKEAEAEALRREKRRQRLMAEGGDAEAEFNRLLEEKRKKNEERRKR